MEVYINMMRKMLLLLFVLSLFVLIAGCGSSDKEKNATIILKANDVHTDDYPTTQSTKYMGKLLEERSNGRIKLQIYSDGQLGDGKVIEDAMADGVIDIDREGIDRYASQIPTLQAFIMPYVFRDSAHVWKVLEGAIGERVKNELKDQDKVVLAFYDSGMRSFYGMKPIMRPEDLSGMQLRVLSGDVFENMLGILQAKSVPLAYNDIYPALQVGKITGAENNIPSYLSAKHFEIAKYYTLDEHMAIPEILFISKQSWDKLSPDDQKLVAECGVEAGQYERKLWDDFTKKGMDELQKQGVQFIKPDKAAFTNAMQPLYAKYPNLVPIIKEIQAVQ